MKKINIDSIEVIVTTHGVALSTIINYYDNTYGFNDFLLMADITPWVVKMCFDEAVCIEIEKIDLFTQRISRTDITT